MERKFKSLATGIICIALVAALGIGFWVYRASDYGNGINWSTIVFGIPYGPSDIDPQYAWDEISFSVIDQVCEGLFKYDLSDVNFAIISNLALSGVWSPDEKEYTVTLRQGVTFQDDAPFNADAVIFTWERLAWALNTTGTNTDRVTQVAELYEFPNGTPIVKNIIKNSDFSVTFVLNDRFAPFKALLCFSASYILSPESTPATAYIDTYTGTLVGTGPFVYKSYHAEMGISFGKYYNYWKGNSQIDSISFAIVPDLHSLSHLALLTGDLDIVDYIDPDLKEFFDLYPYVEMTQLGPSFNITSLCMNNYFLNGTWREAISYAINYTEVMEYCTDGHAYRLESPIPEGMLYSNWSFEVPTYNLRKAREAMQSMDFGVGWNVTPDGPDEYLWQGTTFITLNYSAPYGRFGLCDDPTMLIMEKYLKKIGIEVEHACMSLIEYTNRLYEREGRHKNMLQLYALEWSFNYNDPSTYINPLFTNRSVASNFVQYNGYQAAIEKGRNPFDLWDNVQLLMEEALRTTNEELREQYYWRIQELLVEQDRPWAFLYSRKVYSARVSNLKGYIPNTMGKKWFWPCYYS
jgi:peptide/nickel transport system substrate-binding protein